MIPIFIVLLSVSFPLSSANPQSIAELEKKIEKEHSDLTKMKERMKIEKLHIEKSRSEERSVLLELEVVDRQKQIKEKELHIYDKNLRINEKKKQAVFEKLKETESNIERQKRLLRNRLRAIYKQGDLTYLKVIFSATSFNDFIERYKFMYLIAKSDARLIDDFKENLLHLKKAHESLKKIDSRILLFKDKTLIKKREVETVKRKKEFLLAKVRDEKITYEIAHKELETASRELEELIRQLEKNKVAVREKDPENYSKELDGLLAKKGRLSWPVKGTLISGFGKSNDPKLKIPVLNKGIEIEVPFGTNIRSIETGKIIYAGWLKGYGNVLILDHGKNFYSLYAHNSQTLVEKGDIVVPRQIIAKAGDSGSLKGPLLYFEIRHFWKPVNPLEWLKKE